MHNDWLGRLMPAITNRLVFLFVTLILSMAIPVFSYQEKQWRAPISTTRRNRRVPHCEFPCQFSPVIKKRASLHWANARYPIDLKVRDRLLRFVSREKSRSRIGGGNASRQSAHNYGFVAFISVIERRFVRPLSV